MTSKQPNATKTVHTVAVIGTQDFGSGTLRIGDLDGDGAPDLLLVQSVYETREISCLTAITIHGERLWQTGAPSAQGHRNFSDLAVQVYDWDNDGANEVLYIRQAKYIGGNPNYRERADRYEGDATLVVLDGRTGQEKRRMALPAPADDSFLFADLTGRGRRQDLVVKDRYWNLWGVSFEGQVLWHWQGSTGHFPAVGDVDHDGRDEVFVGFALLDHDGKVLFANPAGDAHSDANWIHRLPDGAWRLLFGNGGLHCLTPDGKELWKVPMSETQHIVAGRFRADSPVQFAAINRGERTLAGVGTLYLVNPDGKTLWKKDLPPGSWGVACKELDWSGAGQPGEILVYGFPDANEYAAIYNGNGEVVDTLPVPWKTPPIKLAGKEVAYATRADVWGDSRQEVILFGGGGVAIYANTRPLALPTHYNETIYSGM
ncbi:MAG: Rhamnogalacturonan endolyase YesW precursor [Lentisphaerae bacterium ADurb.BinA184]|nr:MAG: Rhamnogalacturonan endolyase YesW precursor [Lentisphaerae bacterium ADurb.BinA184]